MKGMKCKKLFARFAVVLTSLFVSYAISTASTSAATLSITVEPTGNKIVPTGMKCVYLYGTPQVDNFCWSFVKNGNNIDYLSRIATNGTIPTTEGYYYEGIVYIRNQSEIPPDLLWSIYTTENFTVTDIEVITDETQLKEFGLSQSGSLPVEYNGSMFDYEFSRFYRVTLRARFTGDYQWAFGYNDALFWSYYPRYVNHNGSIVYIQEINEYKPANGDDEMNKKDDEDRSNLNNQQSSVDSDSDDSQESASSTGTTLLAAFSSFVSAITSARPSNCNINMDMGNLDLGVVNFCQLSPPPEFQTLASIFMILFCVPLSVATARKVINLFRSFQN